MSNWAPSGVTTSEKQTTADIASESKPTGTAAPAHTTPRRRSAIRISAAAFAAIILIGSVVAIATAVLPGSSTTAHGVPPPIVSGATPKAAPGAPSPASAQLVHPLHVPFVVGGDRFAVFVNPHQPWTNAAGRHPLAAGQRFVFVKVLARRLARGAADLRALHYRIVTPEGAVSYPVSGVGTGAAALGPARPMPHHDLVVSRLAFPVSAPLAALRLEFEPTNHGGPTISVSLLGFG